jgi:mRNA-degrading endonuclease toxin of MazEF toxin-antitoxin module
MAVNLDALRTIPVARLDVRVRRLAPTRHVEVKRALGHVLHWPELTQM